MTKAEIKEAIEAIKEYSLAEFGEEADVSDPSNIGLAYTEVDDPEENEHDCQVSVNLIEGCINTDIDGIQVSSTKFEADELIDILESFDFDSWICIEDEEWEKYFETMRLDTEEQIGLV